jgi:hypothetical protein
MAHQANGLVSGHTLLFIAHHLGMGLMEVGGATYTRTILQMEVFTLTFICTWHAECGSLLVNFSPAMYPI